ncbi:MAG TPA: hypothetical protein VE010_17855 [Thermoanaerobaculia bacterium]|nr:hypothetical protein [Thermoanaerobaculia bacterium]
MLNRAASVTVPRFAAFLWLAASLAMVGFAGASWLRPEYRDPFHPSTPFDRTPVSDMFGWYALSVASTCLPPGKTVAVIAPTLAQSQEMYFLAVAKLTRNVPLPAAYFGYAHPDQVAAAQYVIHYRTTPADTSRLRTVCTVPDLAVVYERTGQ